MKDLNRTFLLSMTLISVLCPIICPSARGGSILFTTTVTGSDSYHAAVTDGPFSGDASLAFDHVGYGYVSAWNLWAFYQVESETVSTYAGNLLPSGEVQVGKLSTSGEVEGYVKGKVKGTVNFSMSIGETQPLPPSGSPAPSIQFLFFPTLYADCTNESWPSGAGSSTCGAEASVNIGTSSTPNIPPAGGSATLPVSGKGSSTIYPTWLINAYPGETFTITLTTDLALGGGAEACGSPGHLVICGELGSQGHAIVDPLFEFANPSSAQYYQFEFSPNIPDVPHIPTPEPSALILFGTNLLVFVPLLRRRFGRN